MKTAEKIRLLRLQKGMTQEELGKACGLQRAAINKYEKGTVVNIKRSVLQKLSDALGVLPVDLLDDEEQAGTDSELMELLDFYAKQLDARRLEMLITIAKGLSEEE